MTNSEYIVKLRNAIGDSDWINDPQVVVEAAKAYINLLESKEWQIVPVVPTEKQRDAFWRETGTFDNAYRNIITAAPQYQPEKLDE